MVIFQLVIPVYGVFDRLPMQRGTGLSQLRLRYHKVSRPMCHLLSVPLCSAVAPILLWACHDVYYVRICLCAYVRMSYKATKSGSVCPLS